LAARSSWHYCWELFAAGTSTEDVLAGQHTSGLSEDQVGPCAVCSCAFSP
jgi:hypothetical protein